MIVLNNGDLHRFCQPFDADIDTIAFALSHINRYTGHVGQYSVAQHCVLVSEQLPRELKLSGLLHDAPEAYIGDVSKPLKALLPEYQSIEQWYHTQIDELFDVTTEHPAIKEADLRMLITEAEAFNLPLDEFPKAEPYSIDFKPWPAEVARLRFLECFQNYFDL
ncbi:hypothetical protein [Vibrio hippocampi]|jgi:hypothetical protein|uniref:Phosphohydrolase n=1 Tax=Vibrio hippocampi TaxID=654686 RepID=A0ABN8DP36_9VIBR|nr:hypothetical protein [Vibrio hippocampi]CAH0531248.1 hypothetical protein VHP8226_04185 [Vibrio hippocampi]